VATPIQVVIDCADPARLAEFWAAALGYVVQPPPDGFDSWEGFLTSIGVPEERWNDRSAVVDPDEAGPRLFFQMVPEPKTVKNRVHVDLSVAGRGTAPDVRVSRVDAKVAELLALGATIQRRGEENGERWVVMQDPEGNEFCVQ